MIKMIRDLPYDKAWEQTYTVLETLEDEDDMLMLLEGQLSYVLDCYYKREAHAELLLDMVERIRDGKVENRIIHPEFYEHEKETQGTA